MLQVRVRDATEHDIAAIADFAIAEAREAEGRSLDRAVVTAAVTAALRDPQLAHYWVADDAGALRGVIGVVREWSEWNNAAYWWLQLVFVVPDARGRGVVTQLIDHVARRAAAAGAPELRLYVHPDNARAIRAYQRFGFTAPGYRIMTLPLVRAGEPAALSDDELWQSFHDRSLAHAQWTHAAHLRMAWLHLARYELDEAHLRMRAGIIRLNAAHGLIETPERGYHETLTRVWLVLVRAARRRALAADSTAIAADPALDRAAPLAYYRRERLFSVEARSAYVPPDLAPLPD